MAISRWRAELQRLVDELGGGTVEKTRSGHYAIRLAMGGPVVYTSGTPGDHRVIHNTRAKLRRTIRGAS